MSLRDQYTTGWNGSVSPHSKKSPSLAYTSFKSSSSHSSRLRELLDHLWTEQIHDNVSNEENSLDDQLFTYDGSHLNPSTHRYETGQVTWLHKINSKYSSIIQKGLTSINDHIDAGKEISPEYFDGIFYRCFELCQTTDHDVTKWRALQTLVKLMDHKPIAEDAISPILSMLITKVSDSDSSTRRFALKGLAVITEKDSIPIDQMPKVVEIIQKGLPNQTLAGQDDRWFNGTNMLGQAIVNVLQRKLLDSNI
jgi:hypothetical protein